MRHGDRRASTVSAAVLRHRRAGDAMGFRPAGPAQNVAGAGRQPGRSTSSPIRRLSLFPPLSGIRRHRGERPEIRRRRRNPSGRQLATQAMEETAQYLGQHRAQGPSVCSPGLGLRGHRQLGMVRFGCDRRSVRPVHGRQQRELRRRRLERQRGSLPAGSALVLLAVSPIPEPVHVTQKIMYLSPAFAGFDFGAAYAPTSTGARAPRPARLQLPDRRGVAGAAGGLITQARRSPARAARRSPRQTRPTTPAAANIYDIGARYRGLFGPVGFAAYVDYVGSGRSCRTVPISRKPGRQATASAPAARR